MGLSELGRRGFPSGSLLLLFLLAALSATVTAQSCSNATVKQLVLSSGVQDLAVKNSFASNAPGISCQTWLLNSTAYTAAKCNSSSWLVLEFYRLKWVDDAYQIDGISNNTKKLFFMAAKGKAPKVTVVSGSATVDPPRNPGTSGSGTFMDMTGWTYGRAYQRILISNFTGGNATWFISVTNLGATIDGYFLRGTCVAPPDIPCPRPLPHEGECSNANDGSGEFRGTCSQAVPTDPTSGTCSCSEGWGDYGCSVPTPVLQPGVATSVPVLQGGQWQYYTIPVPSVLPNGEVPTALVVQMSRNSQASLGADPALFVKPTNTGDRSVPYWPDFYTYADTASAGLEQPLHYIVEQDLSPPAFYIGVVNDNTALPATLTLTARWASASTRVCPNNCYGRGQCLGPTDNVNYDASPALALLPPDRNQGFVCQCNRGYAGLLCEGTLQTGSVGTASFSSTVMPGQWAYHIITLSSQFSFDFYGSSTLSIYWHVQDSTNSWITLNNALLSISEDEYPTQSQASSPRIFRRGVLNTYPEWYTNTTGASRPFTIPGSQLLPVPYVLGVYNSPYTRLVPFQYQLDLNAPTSDNGSRWVHTYVSVILAIMGAIFLCVFLTVLKIFCAPYLARHPATFRLLFWRPGMRGAQGQGGGGGFQMATVATARMGVPPHIVDTFPTYSYAPPKGLSPTHATTATAINTNASTATATDTVTAAVPGAVDGAGAGGGAGGVLLGRSASSLLAAQGRTRSDRLALQAAAAEAATAAATAALVAAQASGGLDSEGHSPLVGATAAAGTAPGQLAESGTAGGAAGAKSETPGQQGVTTQRVSMERAGSRSMAQRRVPPPSDAAAQAATEAAHRAAAATLAAAIGGPGQAAGQAGRTSHEVLVPKADDEAPSCTVCLCEYEGGDEMRRLPCGHDFHQACIDKWMTQHTTCPICRVGLVPQEVLAMMERDRALSEAVEAGRAWTSTLSAPAPQGWNTATAWGSTRAEAQDPFASPLPTRGAFPAVRRAPATNLISSISSSADGAGATGAGGGTGGAGTATEAGGTAGAGQTSIPGSRVSGSGVGATGAGSSAVLWPVRTPSSAFASAATGVVGAGTQPIFSTAATPTTGGPPGAGLIPGSSRGTSDSGALRASPAGSPAIGLHGNIAPGQDRRASGGGGGGGVVITTCTNQRSMSTGMSESSAAPLMMASGGGDRITSGATSPPTSPGGSSTRSVLPLLARSPTHTRTTPSSSRGPFASRASVVPLQAGGGQSSRLSGGGGVPPASD